jgi:hypothetical protein
VRLGPSTPGDYVRARVLVPLKPGCDKDRSYWRSGLVAYYRGKHPCDHRMTNASHGGAVKGWRRGATTVSIEDSGDGCKATSPAQGTEG